MQQFSLIPDSAPFSNEQRAWLNGFLAGWIGLPGGPAGSASGGNGSAAILGSPPNALAAVEEDEDFPWHDPALPLDDRLQLAEGKPFERRLMSAMAQLDCGSCGYDCRRYAEAIASGGEKSLTLCSPGGKATSKKLKELFSLEGAVRSNGSAHASNGSANGHSTIAAPITESQWSRGNPFAAKIECVRNLNGVGSAKHTSHVEIDLRGSSLTYNVGDSLGICPTNCSDLVQTVIGELDATGEELVEIDGEPVPLRMALGQHFCLTEVTDELLICLASRCADASQAAILKQLLEESEPIDGWDVLELLRRNSAIRLTASELTSSLARLKPRLYSISSSLKAHPERVHLTVGRVSWKFRDRVRKGVASTMFADRLTTGDAVRVFVQKSHGFTVPKDQAAAAIMIGPGTGIAPFRAFLQERRATAAIGKNWVFFGDQQASTDFLYREEFEEYLQLGLLTRLDVAFSRDQAEKVYVQDRMLQRGEEFWHWLEEGAYLFVCGDAKRMAVDVDKMLRRIISEFGGNGPDGADDYVVRMLKDKRYCRDVY